MLYGDIPLSLLARSYMRLQTKSASYWDATGKAGLYLKELRAHFDKYHTFIQRETIPQRRLWSLWTSALLLITYFFSTAKDALRCVKLNEEKRTEHQPLGWQSHSHTPEQAHGPLYLQNHSFWRALTRELGLSNTTKMTKMLAFWAAWTAARTLSLPSRKRPRPSETMRSSCAISVEAAIRGGREKGSPLNNWKPSAGPQNTQIPGNCHILHTHERPRIRQIRHSADQYCRLFY